MVDHGQLTNMHIIVTTHTVVTFFSLIACLICYSENYNFAFRDCRHLYCADQIYIYQLIQLSIFLLLKQNTHPTSIP
jgi:hypothetical protein